VESAIDECLDELRKAFDDIDHWIHVPFFNPGRHSQAARTTSTNSPKYAAAATLHAATHKTSRAI
jgi:hypothetical protein